MRRRWSVECIRGLGRISRRLSPSEAPFDYCMNMTKPIATLLLLTTLPLLAQDLRPMADAQLPDLLSIYQDLHRHPELSYQEARTSALLAGQLRKAGYSVTEHIGKRTEGGVVYGVLGILKNGAGPTVLVRTEMDALPVEEKTGLPYASESAGVMHACGHDLHMTCFLGTARLLARLKDRWHGTVMLVGQPAEERGEGASAMLAGGLYERFGKPDYVIAEHDNPEVEVGKVAVVSGPVLAAVSSVDVTIRGMGGHGARPEATKDPIVAAAQFVMALQTIVSRQTAPQDPAVVTVGSIHGGTKHNIIPDEVKLQLTTRAFKEDVMQNILADIERTARGVALAAGFPEDRAPIVTVSERDPATYNDPTLAGRLRKALGSALGAGNVIDGQPVMASEDFGLFGLPGRQLPVFMLWLGASDPGKLQESLRIGKPLPSLHSSLFCPVPEPAIRTGVISMTASVLDLLSQ